MALARLLPGARTIEAHGKIAGKDVSAAQAFGVSPSAVAGVRLKLE